MENHAIMKILSLELRQVSNRKILGLVDPVAGRGLDLMNCQGLCHGFLLIHYTKIMASLFEKSCPVILGMAPII